ncbi:hypothetical protein XCR_0736 [Xanthomonas campestris pv. raphani 756C]|nr:hypothetical protein XCR_0736 [Xanthomonas campestris pv. raphani 756C]
MDASFAEVHDPCSALTQFAMNRIWVDARIARVSAREG